MASRNLRKRLTTVRASAAPCTTTQLPGTITTNAECGNSCLPRPETNASCLSAPSRVDKLHTPMPTPTTIPSLPQEYQGMDPSSLVPRLSTSGLFRLVMAFAVSMLERILSDRMLLFPTMVRSIWGGDVRLRGRRTVVRIDASSSGVYHLYHCCRSRCAQSRKERYDPHRRLREKR